MKKFLDQFSSRISGVISCFDRMVFKGHLPLGWPDAMERLLARQRLQIKDFKSFVMRQSERIREHAETLAAQAGRPFLYVNGKLRKDDYARDIAARDAITEGLVCVIRVLEPCQSFKMVPGEHRPRLVTARCDPPATTREPPTHSRPHPHPAVPRVVRFDRQRGVGFLQAADPM